MRKGGGVSERTKIEWADSTASPWTGCTPVSAGCDHCYARTLAKRYGWSREWGAGVPRHRFAGFERAVMAMERKAAAGWFKQCTGCGARGWANDHGVICGNCGISLFAMDTARPRVFPSLCDWLDPEVPVEWLADLLDVIRRTPHLDHLLLTKRPGRAWERLSKIFGVRLDCRPCHFFSKSWRIIEQCMPHNVWIGATVENQAAAEERIPELLRIPAARRFISVEPCLGPVDLTPFEPFCSRGGSDVEDGIHWVICGGESGPGARPMHPDWPRTLRDQCVSAGVPFVFKHWGEWSECTANGHDGFTKDHYWIGLDGAVYDESDAPNDQCACMQRVGKERAGRLLDGREWNEMPK